MRDLERRGFLQIDIYVGISMVYGALSPLASFRFKKARRFFT